MCGIAGYVQLSSPFRLIDESLLIAMAQSLIHRGPDSQGIWKSDQKGVGFAFRRLSIIDLSAAASQPMVTRDGSVVVVFNGEIYNHTQLRKELEACGYSYFSDSDTETLLYAYQEWGIDFLNRLEGDFAFVLFDVIKNELYCARDRVGVKPLYFAEKDGYFAFASEIKALWKLPWLSSERNERALYHYLTFMVTPAPLTLYQDVYKLPAGYYIKIDAQRQVSFHEWYSPIVKISPEEEKLYQNEDFCIERVRSLLYDSVKKRMMSDVPFGVFLSGGIDSSLNVAYMSQFTSQVKTFNISFSDGPEYSEVQWARKVAKHFGTDHHEMIISEQEAFNFFEKMVYHQDEPLADCVCIPLYYVAHLAKQSGVTVVQVGEGSDELFCGYSSYARFIDIHKRLWKPAQVLVPAFVRKGISSLVNTFLPKKEHYKELLHNWSEGRSLFWGGAIVFREIEKNALFSKTKEAFFDPMVERIYAGMNQSLSSYEIVDYYLRKLALRDPHYDFLKGMIYLEFKQRLPELLLMRVDKMTMATSVEGRVPFLDHKLVECAFNIPSHFKYKKGVTKYILKKAAEGILPHDVIYRKKVGFAAPITRWFRSHSFFKKSIQQSFGDVKKYGFNPAHLESMLKHHEAQTNDYATHLWVIHNLLASLKMQSKSL